MAMGLLDDLKKQADLVKTQQILQQNLQETSSSWSKTR